MVKKVKRVKRVKKNKGKLKIFLLGIALVFLVVLLIGFVDIFFEKKSLNNNLDFSRGVVLYDVGDGLSSLSSLKGGVALKTENVKSSGKSKTQSIDFSFDVSVPDKIEEGRENILLVNSSKVEPLLFTKVFSIFSEKEKRIEERPLVILDTVPGEPKILTRPTTILIPKGREVSKVILNLGEPVDVEGEFFFEPTQMPTHYFPGHKPSGAVEDVDLSFYESYEAYPEIPAGDIKLQKQEGYELMFVNLNPILYYPALGKVQYYPYMGLEVETISLDGEEEVEINKDSETVEEIEESVDNPDTVDSYTSKSLKERIFSASDDDSILSGEAEYIIITDASLESAFQPLIEQKQSKGLSVQIFNTDFIYENYEGSEINDNPDKIRSFIRDAYNTLGTKWVLLGGDDELMPHRGVYINLSGWAPEYNLPTDMYFSCLDGPWNGDGDELWGESEDGVDGGEIDLLPEVYIGRVPASNVDEVNNFVAKTIMYETQTHPNKNTALWMGELLGPGYYYGSFSKTQIQEQVLDSSWEVIELYDSDKTWYMGDSLTAFNNSPHIVNHNGHASEILNARLHMWNGFDLRNEFPYFLYSMGCYSGGFDLDDIGVGEKQVIEEEGAVAVIMNTRYGWYSSGSYSLAYNDYFDLEFWDAVFHENKTSFGEANADSKFDNIHRTSSGGDPDAYKWAYLNLILLGDPETQFQVEPYNLPPNFGNISGMIWEDKNENEELDVDEYVLSNEVVYIDFNKNNILNKGFIFNSTDTPLDILPDETFVSNLSVENVLDEVFDINLILNINHTADRNIWLALTSPDGTRVNLFRGVGSILNNFVNTKLDDEALDLLISSKAPFTGSFRPLRGLSSFKGVDANGNWSLEIYNENLTWTRADEGILINWSLEINNLEKSGISDSEGKYLIKDISPGSYDVKHNTLDGWEVTSPLDKFYDIKVFGNQINENIDFLINPLVRETPLSPSELSLNVLSTNNISLEWSDDSNNELFFEIERSLDDVDYSLIGSSEKNINSYMDSNLENFTTYYYRVRAVNSYGESDYSNSVSETTLSRFNCQDLDKDYYVLEHPIENCGYVCGFENSEECVGSDDCNDNNEIINLGMNDSSCDLLDNDCDLEVDEEYIILNTTCGLGVCYDEGILYCEDGVEINTCVVGEPSEEVCDLLDNDCDGFFNEGVWDGTMCNDGYSCTWDICNIFGRGGLSECQHHPADGYCDELGQRCNPDWFSDTITGCGSGTCVDVDNDNVADFDAELCPEGKDVCDFTNQSYFEEDSTRLQAHVSPSEDFYFEWGPEGDILNFSNVTLFSNNNLRVKFLESLRLIRVNESGCFEKTNISQVIELEEYSVRVDTDVLKGLNESAVVFFYNVSFNDSVVYRDGIECLDCEFIIYENETMELNVSGFSTYLVRERPYCGDSFCDSDESCSSCVSDCGGCPISGGGNGGGSNGGGNGGGGSPPSEWKEVYSANDSESREGFTRELSKKERVSVIINNKKYYGGIVNLNKTSIVISVSSVSQDVNINIGEEKGFDVDEDGTDDLVVRLNNISEGRAEINLKVIEIVDIDAGDDDTFEEDYQKSVYLKIILIIGLASLPLVGIIIYFILRFKGKPKKDIIKDVIKNKDINKPI
jgi:subtilisin-like proprotein convertase family protein